jgi:hypothetical protein
MGGGGDMGGVCWEVCVYYCVVCVYYCSFIKKITLREGLEFVLEILGRGGARRVLGRIAAA